MYHLHAARRYSLSRFAQCPGKGEAREELRPTWAADGPEPSSPGCAHPDGGIPLFNDAALNARPRP